MSGARVRDVKDLQTLVWGSPGLQKTLARIMRLAHSLCRRVSLTLHDMQWFELDGSLVKNFISR
jgi:hypothetical protein